MDLRGAERDAAQADRSVQLVLRGVLLPVAGGDLRPVKLGARKLCCKPNPVACSESRVLRRSHTLGMNASFTKWRRPAGRSPRVAIFGLVAVEAFVVLAFGSNTPASGDGPGYLAYASNLVHRGVFSLSRSAPYIPSVFRQPGYPAFLVPFVAVFGRPLLYIRIAQFGLLGVTSLLVYHLARVLGAVRVALPSALLCITYLPFVWLAREELTDTLATTLTVAVVLLFCLIRQSPNHGTRLRLCLLTAAVGAALSYVRPEFSVLVLLLSALLLGERRGLTRTQRVALAGSIVAGMLLLLLPWAIRNESASHAFVPVGSASGDDLYASALQYSGAVGYANFDYVREGQLAGKVVGLPPLGVINAQQEALRNRRLQHAAWKVFRSVSLIHVVRSVPDRLAQLWSTADTEATGPGGLLAHRLAQLQYAAFVVLLALGLAFEARDRLRRVWPLLLLPLYLTLLHLVSHEEPRYSLIGRPFLLILVAIGGLTVYDRLANTGSQK